MNTNMSHLSNRYGTVFKMLDDQQQIAWIPFVMLGYPDMKSSIKVIETLISSGADALEIGIPFSDPVADGVLIQDSARIALEQGSTVKGCFAAIKSVRENYQDIPIGLLTYANLVFKPGIERFYSQAALCGIDSVLIADCPLSESKDFLLAASNHNVSSVFIAPPNASEEKIQQLSQQDAAYTYVVSRPGVTGDDSEVKFPQQVITGLLKNNAPSPVLGFGISAPEHVTVAISYGFKGVISGSAITRILSDHLETVIKKNSNSSCYSLNDDVYNELSKFSSKMKAATCSKNNSAKE